MMVTFVLNVEVNVIFTDVDVDEKLNDIVFPCVAIGK